MEATIHALASCQECERADVDGLSSGALGQTESETDTAQFSLSLGPEKMISVSADTACAE